VVARPEASIDSSYSIVAKFAANRRSNTQRLKTYLMQYSKILFNLTALINELEAKKLSLYVNIFLSPNVYHPPGCNPTPGSDRVPVKIHSIFNYDHFCLLLDLMGLIFRIIANKIVGYQE